MADTPYFCADARFSVCSLKIHTHRISISLLLILFRAMGKLEFVTADCAKGRDKFRILSVTWCISTDDYSHSYAHHIVEVISRLPAWKSHLRAPRHHTQYQTMWLHLDTIVNYAGLKCKTSKPCSHEIVIFAPSWEEPFWKSIHKREAIATCMLESSR